ncbi:MAG TPA: hypothetical protein VKB25_07645 [Conexibacter sp.]|nr:hypothetical protein [Conexibacter sp.]
MNPPRSIRALRCWLLVGVLLATVALLALLLAGYVLGFLYLAPVLVLCTILGLGCYPADRLLLGRAHEPTRPVARRLGRLRPRRAALPRGGGLLARRMAGRAPPWTPAPAQCRS